MSHRLFCDRCDAEISERDNRSRLTLEKLGPGHGGAAATRQLSGVAGTRQLDLCSLCAIVLNDFLLGKSVRGLGS